MAILGNPGGLSLPELIRRTARESWEDEVFGQSGRMAFYHFLAIFPALLVFLAIGARFPHSGDPIQNSVQDFSRQLLPDQITQLFRQMTDELSKHTLNGFQLLSVCAGALWALLNGTWAMLYGLNRAYEVNESRSWRELSATIAGLTLALGITVSVALFLIYCSVNITAHLPGGEIALRALEWLVLTTSLSLSFSILYRFAPDLRARKRRWSTPGTLCALVLWITATFGARIYFDHVSDYSRSYGHLNSVVILLLWLYVTNGAILIGGEMNSEIEKAAASTVM